MKYTINYDRSEDLLADNSSLLSIYDDVLCNHTIGDYNDLNSYNYNDDDLFSFDDASDGSLLFHNTQVKVVPNQVLQTSTNYQNSNAMVCEAPMKSHNVNPRRWETATPVKKMSHDLPTLVRLNENGTKSDDSTFDGLSIDLRSDLLSVNEYPPPPDISVEWTGKSFGGLSSRVQMPRIFPSYKDILTSKYFFV